MWWKRLKRRHRFTRKRNLTYLLFLFILLSMGMGYALLNTTLGIDGTSHLANAKWDIHFDNIQVKEGSVNPTSAATITDDTTVGFSVTLENPGDFYEFNVDVVNAGTINAMIDTISIQPVLTENQQKYLDYIVTYSDGVSLGVNQRLDAGDSETLRIAFIYKEADDPDDYPDEDEDITMEVSIIYVQENGDAEDVPHPPTLYGVLKDAAEEGTYATQYTGTHHDSFTEEPTKNIYHWFADNDTEGTAILDKNNVIFAGHCWQMIRTTDTGGVKMIYNGEAVNNQCLNTRGTHVGYVARTSQNLASNYWYGTDYTYENGTFKISGITKQEAWNATTGPGLVGKYTCKNTNVDGTCETLYLVESYNNSTSGYVITLNSDSHYSQFGTLPYNTSSNSIAYVGYMHNTVYPFLTKSNTFYISNSSATIDSSYYYSDTIDYNNITPDNYTLINPVLISSLVDNNNLVGKYVLNNAGTTSTQVRYVVAVSGTTYYYKTLIGGSSNTSLTIGDTYTESGGVYTLSGNVTNVSYTTWYNTSDPSVFKGKYVCDGNNTSCTNLMHICPTSNPKQDSYLYFGVDDGTYFYAEDVSYDGTTYTLSGNIKQIWDIYDNANQIALSTHHYTCLDVGTSCTKVGYVYYLNGSNLYYVQLTGVEDISEALTIMLQDNNINSKNSTIKTGIDAWYGKYLSAYDSYIEDTIFCNDRTIKTLGGWDPNGGMLDIYLQFNEINETSGLSCELVTDKFSTLNTNAQLTYKIGLMSSPEMNLLNKGITRETGQVYWLGSPHTVARSYVYVRRVLNAGNWNGGIISYSQGVRPAISLIPGITYSTGDGSMANPYIVNTD